MAHPHWTPTKVRNLIARFIVSLWFGLMFGHLVGLVLGNLVGLAFGLVYGFFTGLMLRNAGRGDEPARVKLVGWRVAISRRVLWQALTYTVTVLIGLGLAVGIRAGLDGDRFMIALSEGFGAALTVGLTVVVASGLLALIAGGTSEGSPLGPREVWRNDRLAGLVIGLAVGFPVGVISGFMVGLLAGPVGGLTEGFAAGLVFGLTVWLCFGLPFVLMYPANCVTTLAWLQLQWSSRVPTVRLMPFLEDARKRDVLRTVGAVYQFRHATLQDHLARRSIVAAGQG